MSWLNLQPCALCGRPAWPGLWRWCTAVYCSPVCRDIDRIPVVVPAYPPQSNTPKGAPLGW